MRYGRSQILAGLSILVLITIPDGHCRADDWPVFGRDHTRNAVSPETDPPTDWDVETGRNIKWKAEVSSSAFGAPVVSDGLVWIGGSRWRPGDDDESMDAALLLCFDERTGEKLYEYVSPRLRGVTQYTDPPFHGLGSSPLIEGDRLWFVTNRCETVCLDIAPLKAEPRAEPVVVWKVDMREEFGVYPCQSFMGPSRLCSIAPSWDGMIFVSTANGAKGFDTEIAAPDAPGLICFDRITGEAKWIVSTGENVLFSELASPLVAEIAGRGQVVMPHGDGWVRSYDPHTGRLLWEFDVNPKESLYTWHGRSDRNFFVSTPVLFEDRLYIAGGMEIERGGSGPGRLVCIDPTGSGDVSAELAVDRNGNVIPPRRFQNVDADAGEQAIPNPNSGLVWEYTGEDINGDRKVDFEETMHRTMANVVIRNGLLLIPDFSGIVHCLDARTGDGHWTYDPFSQIPASPLIVDDTVYFGTEEGTILLFRLAAARQAAPIAEVDVNTGVFVPPVFANGVLYITSRNMLYAIQQNQPDE